MLRFALTGIPAGKYLATYTVAAEVGGTPTSFECRFDRGPVFANPVALNVGVPSDVSWHVSGAGLLDTTAGAYSFSCNHNGDSITIPSPSPGGPGTATVVLTRVDSVQTIARVGTPEFPHRPAR